MFQPQAFIKKIKLKLISHYCHCLFTIHKCFQYFSFYDVCTFQLWRVSVASPCALVDGSGVCCCDVMARTSYVTLRSTMKSAKGYLDFVYLLHAAQWYLAAQSKTFPEFFNYTLNVYNVPKMTTLKSRMLWLSELKWITTVLSLLCFMSATCSLMLSPTRLSVSPTYTILLHSAQSKPYIIFVVSQLFLRFVRISIAWSFTGDEWAYWTHCLFWATVILVPVFKYFVVFSMDQYVAKVAVSTKHNKRWLFKNVLHSLRIVKERHVVPAYFLYVQ